MIRLSKANRAKLAKLIIQRDAECWETYEEILGIPFPSDGINVHHVIPVGSGGEDIAENLISLDPKVHFYKFHYTWGGVVKAWQKKAQEYLNSEAVKTWDTTHEESLKAVYRTAETTRIQKIRKGCIPEKRPGLMY